MSWKTPSIVITVMVASLFTGNLHAQDTGWYAGAAAGQSTVDIDESFWRDSSIIESTLDTEGFNFQVYGGYRLNRFFAVEAGYLKIADTVFNGVSNGVNTLWNAGEVEGFTKIDGFMLQGVVFIPSGISRLKFYTKGGLFFSNTRTIYHSTINDIIRFPDDGVTLIGGIGLQARVWRGWHLRGETQYTIVPLKNSQNVDVSYVTLGLMHPIE